MAKFIMKNVKINATNGGKVEGYETVGIDDSELSFKEKSIDFTAKKEHEIKRSKSSRFWKLVSENKLISGLILLIIASVIKYFFFSN